MPVRDHQRADRPAETIMHALRQSIVLAGRVEVEGTLIRHQVTLASNPARVGKEMIRHAEYADDVLTLTTPQESFGKAILVWRRVKP